MEFNSIMWCLIFLHTICQVAIFTGVWLHYKTNNDFRCVCKKFQESFPLAKSSAALISFNLSLLTLFSIKLFKRYVWVPSVFKVFHSFLSIFVLTWSAVHSVSHYINFSKLKNPPYFNWGVGYTGIFLWILLISLFSVAANCIRTLYFHKFIYYHTVIFVLFVIFSFIHQSFCFIKTDSGKCPIPISWIFVTPPFILLLAENAWKYIGQRSRISIRHVVKHNNIIEIQLPLERSFAGKTVWICCPQISYFEWHPFTVTNTDLDIASIHFKLRGNWTSKFAKSLGIEFDKGQVFPVIFPDVLVQGPFHCYPKNTLQSIQTSDSIIIANGIGITTFAYLLTQIQNLNVLSTSLNVLFIVKYPTELDWLMPTLQSLLSKFPAAVQLTISYTQVTEAYSSDQISIGRPDIKKFFHSHYISTIHQSNPKTNVYFSGTSQLFSELKKSSQDYTSYYQFIKL